MFSVLFSFFISLVQPAYYGCCMAFVFVPINLPPSLNEACANVAVRDHQMSLQLNTLNSVFLNNFLYYRITLIIYTLIIRARSSM